MELALTLQACTLFVFSTLEMDIPWAMWHRFRIIGAYG